MERTNKELTGITHTHEHRHTVAPLIFGPFVKHRLYVNLDKYQGFSFMD